jgi:hypothetical protein
MGHERFNRRTDEQLTAILNETADSVVCGHSGQALCRAIGLQQALDRAEAFAASGAIVVALCRRPGDDIIVFLGQATRIREALARGDSWNRDKHAPGDADVMPTFPI